MKGKVKAGCPVGGRQALDTRVVVTGVDAGEHTLFHLFSSGTQGRSDAKPGEGNLNVDTVEEGKPVTKTVAEPTGKHRAPGDDQADPGRARVRPRHRR